LSLLLTGAALSGEPLRRGTVEIRGDVEIAEKFQELLRLLTPDLEEELALLVGDVPAHRAGQFGARDAALEPIRPRCAVAGHRRVREPRAPGSGVAA